VLLQIRYSNIDFITKAGGLISLFATIFLFHRLLGLSLDSAASGEFDIDCGKYDGSSIEQHNKEARRVVLKDYFGILLLVIGSLISIFGDMLKAMLFA
jgi:hypothetical protein